MMFRHVRANAVLFKNVYRFFYINVKEYDLRYNFNSVLPLSVKIFKRCGSFFESVGWVKIKNLDFTFPSLQQDELTPVTNDACAEELAALPGKVSEVYQYSLYIQINNGMV